MAASLKMMLSKLMICLIENNEAYPELIYEVNLPAPNLEPIFEVADYI